MFENKKLINLEIEEQELSMGKVIDILRREHLKEKEEMFVQGNSVRPGIIVLVNDTDWELLETTDYMVQSGDNVAFISTLHGG